MKTGVGQQLQALPMAVLLVAAGAGAAMNATRRRAVPFVPPATNVQAAAARCLPCCANSSRRGQAIMAVLRASGHDCMLRLEPYVCAARLRP